MKTEILIKMYKSIGRNKFNLSRLFSIFYTSDVQSFMIVIFIHTCVFRF